MTYDRQYIVPVSVGWIPRRAYSNRSNSVRSGENRLKKALIHVAAAMLLGAFAPTGAAYEFVPTPLEWAGWPAFCKARYVTLPVGTSSQYSRNVARSEVDYWKSSLGEGSFTHVHHFCAGLSWLGRAQLAANEGEKSFDLDRAQEECAYTHRAIEQASPVFPDVAVCMARVAQARGDFVEAESFLQTAIDVQPGRVQPYAALALLYRAQSRFPDALKVLHEGDKQLNGESAEIQYYLGLIYLQSGDQDAALKHALKAYELGYPLPGLRDKLTALGKWPGPAAGPIAAGG